MKVALDTAVELIISMAKKEALQNNHKVLTAEHLLFSALHIYPIKKLMESLHVDIHGLRKDIENYLSFFIINTGSNNSNENIQEIRKSESFVKLIELAYLNTVREERKTVTLRDLLKAFMDLDQQNNSGIPYSHYINRVKLQNTLLYGFDYDFLHLNEDKDLVFTDMEMELFSSLLGHDEQEAYKDETAEYQEENVLTKLTTNLCEVVKTGRDDVFIGKERLIDKMFEILLRRKKNNIILMGDPGVGKTAIVHAFAQRLVRGMVPDELKQYTLLSLDIVSLVAGTRYRGDFEDRVKQLFNALTESPKYILFLDDIHSIINAGSSTGNSNDFGDLVKPLLEDNAIRCIGATTFDDFKNFEQQKSILRRFNIIEYPETSKEDTLEILITIKKSFEKYYGIQFSNKVLEHLVELSSRYITERAFPDKAIDILDSVGARLKVRNFNITSDTIPIKQGRKPIKVTVSDIEEIVSNISNRPVHSVRKNEFRNLKTLRSRLSKKIFGQEKAIDSLCKVILRSRAGLRLENKPIASFLFVGPTGVGKTEVTAQLAHELGMNFTRYDMSEYQEHHTLSKLIGAPPGYVGHEQGGSFIDAIRKHPNTVLLLDEIEKAHHDIYDLLLQVMDYATVTDSLGRRADFRNVIIIMTSNVGITASNDAVVGFENSQLKGAQEIKKAIVDTFSPEFRNRLDETIIFSSLTVYNLKSIVIKEFININNILTRKNAMIEWNRDVVHYLVSKGYNSIYGARSVIRVIEEEVKDKLSERIIQHNISSKNKKLILVLSTLKKTNANYSKVVTDNAIAVTSKIAEIVNI